MDAGSDSSRCELDSVASADSLQMITDELQLHQLSACDVTNSELSKQVSTLELDNECLRIDLENARIELNAKNAANQGLKNKIAELYMEAQTSLQEKQKLQNSIKDTESKLASAENSTKWYQEQVHTIQANKRSLQVEIDTYQYMLRQKHQSLVNMTAKWKQLNEDYSSIVQKHREEKESLQAEIDALKTKDDSFKNCYVPQAQHSMVPMSAYTELSDRLALAEEKLEEAQADLQALKQRLTYSEVERSALTSNLATQCTLLSSTEDSLQRCQSERAELANSTLQLRSEMQKLGLENENLQMTLLAARQEREQVEEAIEQLRGQLTKMLSQHRLLKNRNSELEEKLTVAQDTCNENRRLKSLFHSANASLFRKLRQERRKTSSLQKQLVQEQNKHRTFVERYKTDASVRECLKQALERNKELKNQLKVAKSSEESIDEGYADSNSVAGFSLTNLPSPKPMSPTLLRTIDDVLARSKHFWEPIQSGLDDLYLKLEAHQADKMSVSSCYDALQMSTPPPSPQSHARSLT